MSNQNILKAMLAGWAVLFIVSLGWRYGGPDGGPANPILISNAGQFVAGGLAMMIWSSAKRLPKGTALRRTAAIPIVTTVAMIALALFVILRAMNRI